MSSKAMLDPQPACPPEEIPYIYIGLPFSLMAQLVKNLPAMQDTWVQSLGQESLRLVSAACQLGLLVARS